MALKIGVACGGTGGHVFPGLATADALVERGHAVKLWLAGKDIEAPAVKTWKGPLVTVRAEGLPHGFSLRAVRAAWKLACATMACRRIMKRDRPDVLLAMGSYASVGPVGAALSLGIPVVLHEANVLPGRVISLFAGRAAAVAGSFEETRFYLRRKEIVITGMPVRRDVEQSARSGAHQADHERFTILVMGGSRGAHRLNDIASAAIARVHAGGHLVKVIHLAGTADETAVRKVYESAGVCHEVHGFAQDMGAIYAATDLAICRSGAATCAELSVFAVPSLLVPYPFAANDHQTMNAKALEKVGAADVVPEHDLSVAWLSDYVVNCLREPGRLARMSAAVRSRAAGSAAEALADLVVNVGETRRGSAPQPG
jgi:UDP-N-acetylglucosamine--N-acetylmuramyl-(pentapeptide) pyrophosphoryl-undecaprenol N-acetylglucosamine transferase